MRWKAIHVPVVSTTAVKSIDIKMIQDILDLNISVVENRNAATKLSVKKTSPM